MKRFTANQSGLAFLEILGVIAILAILATMTVPALAAKSEKDSLPPLVQVLQETQAIDAEMVVAAAELAYMSANTKRDSYTLQELVDRGYLDAKLSDEQAITMVVRTENGAFTYIP